jgi:hypothetical protein
VLDHGICSTGTWTCTQPVNRTSGITNAAASNKTQILDMMGPAPRQFNFNNQINVAAQRFSEGFSVWALSEREESETSAMPRV